jgi:hypothetical protein
MAQPLGTWETFLMFVLLTLSLAFLALQVVAGLWIQRSL